MNSSKPISSESGYAGRKRRTNLSLDKDLVKAAQKYLPSTSHGSLSGFVENSLSGLFRKHIKRLRAAGISLPSDLFTKK